MKEYITSKDNKKIKLVCGLDSKSDRYLIEGFHLVEMALERHEALAVFTTDDKEYEVPTFVVTEEIMKKICSSMNPEGIAAIVRKKEEKPLSSSRVLVLNGVADPGNAGTLMRTALAFGFNDVILTSGSVDPYNSKCVQASQGAILKVNLTKNISSEEACSMLKERGYRIIGTSLQSAVPLDESISKEGKIAIVLGNEARGMDETFRSNSDLNLIIPISEIESLNVSIAGGIMMYFFRK